MAASASNYQFPPLRHIAQYARPSDPCGLRQQRRGAPLIKPRHPL